MKNERYSKSYLLYTIINLTMSLGKASMKNESLLIQRIDICINQLGIDKAKISEVEIDEIRRMAIEIVQTENFKENISNLKPSEKEKFIRERISRIIAKEEKDREHINEFVLDNKKEEDEKSFFRSIEKLENQGKREKILSTRKKPIFVKANKKIEHHIGSFSLTSLGELHYCTAGDIKEKISAYLIKDEINELEKIAYFNISFFYVSTNPECERKMIELLQEYMKSSKEESIIPTIQEVQVDGINIKIDKSSLYQCLDKTEVVAVKEYLLEKDKYREHGGFYGKEDMEVR